MARSKSRAGLMAPILLSFLPSFLQVTLEAEAMAAQLEVPRRADPLARVWLLDGETDTYFTVRPLLRPTDVVLSADPVNEASWNATLALVGERYLGPGHHNRITAVGRIHGKLVTRLLALQSEGRVAVDIEPDAWAFLEQEIARRGLVVTPMWIGRRDLLGTAAHVAALQSSDSHVVMAMWKEEQLARFVRRADKAFEVGGPLPAVDGADRIPGGVFRLDGWMDLVHWGLGSGQDWTPPGMPPDGSRFTIAVYTGMKLCDWGMNVELEQPLSFYDSEPVANALCAGRETCLPRSLNTYVSGIFTPDSTADAICSVVPLTIPGKWNDDVEAAVDAAIETEVNAFNTDPSNVLSAYFITKLAIVAHPLDIPYRRFLYQAPPTTPTYKPCTTYTSYEDGLVAPIQEVDYGRTDNAVPFDGYCDGAVIDANGRMDGQTGSADFEYADYVDAVDLVPSADLAYGRVGASGHTDVDAMTFVSSIRCNLGVGSSCGGSTPKGAVTFSHPELVKSLFDDFYALGSQLYCLEPGLTIPFFCPTNTEPHDATLTTYLFDAHWFELFRQSHLPQPLELGHVKSHQDDTPEASTNRYPSHSGLRPLPAIQIPHFAESCDVPAPAFWCDAHPTWIDRQRIEWAKGADPNANMPYLSSEWLRRQQAVGTPPTLAPGVWFLYSTACSNYNYIDHWYPQTAEFFHLLNPPSVDMVRNHKLGADSSHISTLMPAGLASIFMHHSINPATDGNGDPQVIWIGPMETEEERLFRELTTGSTVGEAIRDVNNYHASFVPKPYDPVSSRPLYHAGLMLWGDPNVKLHQVGTVGPEDVVILVAPGNGSTVDANHGNEPQVKGFNKDGAHLGIPNFLAYSYESYGANVAGGNVDGGANDEILTGAGYNPFSMPPGSYADHVKGFQYDGTPLAGINFFPFALVSHGATVALADFDGDGIDEIMASPGPSTIFGPSVRGYKYDGSALSALTNVNFQAFPLGTNAGVSLAGGDVVADGPADDILVAKGWISANSSEARLFYVNAGTTQPTPKYSATIFGSSYGAFVGVGNIDNNFNGYEDMLFGNGPGPTLAPAIKAYTGGAAFGTPFVNISTDTFPDWAGADDTGLWGTRVAAAQVTSDGNFELVHTRGFEPRKGSTIENSRVIVRDGTGAGTVVLDFVGATPDTGDCYPSDPSCPSSQGVGGGLSIAGINIPNVPVPFQGGGRAPVSSARRYGDATPPGPGNGNPVSPVELPEEVLAPLVQILTVVGETAFRAPGSRAALLASASILEQRLAEGNLATARVQAEALRVACGDQIAWDYLRNEMDPALGILLDHIDLAATNRAPFAVIDGSPGPVCPGPQAFAGDRSFDLDERGLSRDDIQTFTWSVDGRVLRDQRGKVLEANLSAPGVHAVELVVRDTFGGEGRASMYVTVADGTAPVARPEASPAVLSPVDGRMVPVRVSLNDADSCGEGAFVTLVDARSSDPRGCGGFGDPDIVADLGRDDRDVLLRAEACARTRTYTLVYELADLAGNRSRYEATVSVGTR